MGSYPPLFTLTPHKRGGLVSVVLSLSLRTVAVSDYLALCCPDFPLERSQAIAFQAQVYYITKGIKIIPLGGRVARACRHRARALNLGRDLRKPP